MLNKTDKSDGTNSSNDSQGSRIEGNDNDVRSPNSSESGWGNVTPVTRSDQTIHSNKIKHPSDHK